MLMYQKLWICHLAMKTIQCGQHFSVEMWMYGVL